MTLISTAPPYVLSSSRYGVMLVNSNDVYMGVAYLKYGECCQIETDFLLSLIQSSGLVVEVGSNMGVHTVPIALELARQGRKMLAFEPQPIIFQQLCANLALNGLMNVTALPYACGAEVGSVSFTEPDYRKLGNFGATEMVSTGPSTEHAPSVNQVACFTLDGFVAHEDVALIKVDVEGFELAVLQGALATLQRSKPLLYVENDRASSSKELIEWLLNHDYRLWWHTPPLFNPDNCNGIQENLYARVVSLNMLCVPREREWPIPDLEEILEPGIHPVLR